MVIGSSFLLNAIWSLSVIINHNFNLKKKISFDAKTEKELIQVINKAELNFDRLKVKVSKET